MRSTSVVSIALLALAAAAKLPTLQQPLTENYAWRQTQTAWTALIYHQEGIDLLRPEVPVHGPPWVFGFEFPDVAARLRGEGDAWRIGVSGPNAEGQVTVPAELARGHPGSR